MTGLPAKFWAKVEKTDTCWIWTGALNSRGYPCFGVNGKSQLAHRLSYADEHGPIPEGFQIDHVYDAGCRRTDCVNPAHLEAVTGLENVRRYQALVATCSAGHPLTHKPGDRQRRCRPCENEARRQKRKQRRLALVPTQLEEVLAA